MSAADVEELRRSEIKAKTWRRPAAGSKHGNRGGGRTEKGHTLFSRVQAPVECQTKETRGLKLPASPNGHVRINGDVYLYQLKAPFVPSGKSVMGAIEYDSRRDVVKCHECGVWLKSIGHHAWVAHDIDAKAYRQKHGLGQGSSLSCEGLRAKTSSYCVAQNTQLRLRANPPKRVSHGKRRMEGRNAKGLCPAQIMDKLARLRALLGRTPTKRELREHRISVSTMRYMFGSINEAMRLAGLEPRRTNDGVPVNRKYSDEQLMEFLRIFYRLNGRGPASSDFERGFLPSRQVYNYRFGSKARALKAAGLQ